MLGENLIEIQDIILSVYFIELMLMIMLNHNLGMMQLQQSFIVFQIFLNLQKINFMEIIMKPFKLLFQNTIYNEKN